MNYIKTHALSAGLFFFFSIYVLVCICACVYGSSSGIKAALKYLQIFMCFVHNEI